MALGRAEKIFQATGRPVAICRSGGYPRDHEAWHGNPAWDATSSQKIIDGGGERPYIKRWEGRRAVWDKSHKAHAGKICLTQAEHDYAGDMPPRFAVIAPTIKAQGSPNKDFGLEKWAAVIKDLPIPVYQLLPDDQTPLVNGAIGKRTPHFRLAAAVIARAKFVMCNEGGTHHMAASMRVPAVVIFGSFIPPSVTGYDFHKNIAVATEHGFCGDFDSCNECQKAMASITSDMVRFHVKELMREIEAKEAENV